MTRATLARVAFVVWAVALVAISVRVALSSPSKNSVVPVYRAAGERWAARESLYESLPPLDDYRYPPGFAVPFAVLSTIPEKPAAWLWRAAGVTLFLFGLRSFANGTAPGTFPAMALLSGPLMLQCVNNGQANVPLIGCVLIGAGALARSRFTASAVGFALAAAIKIYPVAVGLLAVLLAPKRLGGRFAVALGVVFVAPFACHDPAYVWDQHVELAAWTNVDDRYRTYPLPRVPRDWTVLTRSYFDVVPGLTVCRAVSATAGLVLAGFVLLARRRHGVPSAAAFVVVFGGVWMTAFGPMTEVVTYALLAPGAAWLLVTGRGRPFALALLGYVLNVLPVVRDMFPNGWTLTILGPQPAGALLIAVAGAMRVVRPGKESEEVAGVTTNDARTVRTVKSRTCETIGAGGI
jgi:hypothetical protein